MRPASPTNCPRLMHFTTLFPARFGTWQLKSASEATNPHPPAADVYKNKYGDCKDKANLLVSMLGHVGLRAYPVLVGTRGM